MSEVRTWWNKM